MEFFVVIITMVILFTIITVAGKPKKRRSALKNEPIPDDLGLQVSIAEPIEEKLNKAFPFSYEENVFNRVLKEHPNAKNYEIDWAAYELRRYFVMNAILRSVPMFSLKADEFWHEMIMFTREYEAFSNDFYGGYLHHAPNLDTAPMPGERAFFDWVYLSLFEVEENSKIIWGGFLKNPMKDSILNDFEDLTENALLDKYFRSGEEFMEVKLYLIHKMKEEISESKLMMKNGEEFVLDKGAQNSQLYLYASSAIIFYSMYEPDLFEDHMHDIMPKEMMKEHTFGGSSSCSGFGCSSSSDSDGGGGGSSCGSSCGGGGCSS